LLDGKCPGRGRPVVFVSRFWRGRFDATPPLDLLQCDELLSAKEAVDGRVEETPQQQRRVT